MPINLTPNAIASINGGDVNSKPLVQVTDIKLIGSNQERYRFLISDSVSAQHAMLATQLNDRVKTGQVKIGSVVQLIDYICSTVQNRKIIVVLNMETIILDYEIIGNPKMFTESDSTTQKAIPTGNSEHPVRINNFNALKPGTFNTPNPSTCNAPNPGTFSAPNTSTFRATNSGTFRAPYPGNNVQSFRPTVQPSYEPPPNYRNHGPILKNEAPARIIPIAALNPYQGRWAIKARVTAKGDLRRYNNARGDGKVFSFDLLDSDGGEIRVTCFNAVVDRFYDVIEVGKVYLISKGSLKPAQKNFNHLKNEWEIFLEATSTVDLCPEEDGSIPRQQFFFRSISEIENTENNAILDVIGIVISVNPSVPILRKNGMETQRRILNLKDRSGRSIELTLWGDFCSKEGQKLQEMVDVGFFPVLAVKAGKVNDFSGKSIGTISSTQLFINPEFPEAQDLRQWFDRGGKDTASVSISGEMLSAGSKNEIRKTVAQIKDEGLGRSEKPDWVTVRAFLTFIKSDTFCYTACPLMIGDRQCNKKVTHSGNRWRCDRCNQEFEECDYRYLLQAQIQDQTGLTWVTAFQESGEEIMGCPAKELYMLKYELQDDTRFGEIIRSRVFNQYLFRLKIKEEMFGDEQRVKITVIKADQLNYSSESRYLLDLISKTQKVNDFRPR
ncbi:replication protein A 70 kDa DNA-binding subunit A [Mangifera indica]|uniref:replication protein A 70 kDa DNA-binding subunit A n=1 Tax=Mangifera indica TaxID=29780 RepID=UPI001CFA3FA3|nr:replication protein A 70 kDa DNA-binding subunit A [Mangifera indica]